MVNAGYQRGTKHLTANTERQHRDRSQYAADPITEKQNCTEVFWKRKRSIWERDALAERGEEPGSAKWRLRQRLRTLYHERRKKWVKNELQRRESGFLARHEWKPRPFGPEYSSDNAGDGPRDRKKVKADCEEEKDPLDGMSQRDKALMLAHIAAVRTQNSEGGNWRFEPTRHQFCRKLAEFRASKTRKPRYADIEQYIQQHPFVDQHCISEPQRSDVFKGNNPYTNFTDTMEGNFCR